MKWASWDEDKEEARSLKVVLNIKSSREQIMGEECPPKSLDKYKKNSFQFAELSDLVNTFCELN